jgi:uncharacterized protein (UPF0276 family)
MALGLPHLGHGYGLRHQHFDRLLEEAPGCDFVEAITENFMTRGGRPRHVLEVIRAQVPVVLHGVSLDIGGSDPLDLSYLDALAELVDRYEPAWVSDHLCWGALGGHHAHDLWPLAHDEETLAHVVERVGRVQDRLRRRILLENVSSYASFHASTMSEWDFLSEVARRADCGILLDVNNVLVSAFNHGFDPHEYLEGIPADRVAQLHLAGHTDHGAYLLDSHVGPVPDGVWALYRETLRRFGPVSTLLEWDEEIPALEVLQAEVALAADEAAKALALEAAS